MNADRASVNERFGTFRGFAVVLGIAASIAGVEFYALLQSRHVEPPPTARTAHTARKAAIEEPIGAIDTPVDEAMVGPHVEVSGWALDPAGIARVEIRLDDLRFNANVGIARPDVAEVRSGFPQSDRAGFEFVGDLTPHPAAPGVDRRIVSVVAVAQDGRESILGRKSVIEPAALKAARRRFIFCRRSPASSSAAQRSCQRTTRIIFRERRASECACRFCIYERPKVPPPITHSTPTGTSSGAAASAESPKIRSPRPSITQRRTACRCC